MRIRQNLSNSSISFSICKRDTSWRAPIITSSPELTVYSLNLEKQTCNTKAFNSEKNRHPFAVIQMRLIQLHSDFIEYTPVGKEIEQAEENISSDKVRLEDLVVIL